MDRKRNRKDRDAFRTVSPVLLCLKKAFPLIFCPMWIYLTLKIPVKILTWFYHRSVSRGGRLGETLGQLTRVGYTGLGITILCYVWALSLSLLYSQARGQGGIRRLWGKPGQPACRILAVSACGALYAAALGATVYLLGHGLTGRYAEEMRQYFPQQGTAVLFTAVYVLLAPLAEEIVFRGIVYGALRESLGSFASACLCSILFGLYHDVPFQMAYTAILGFFLCLLAERYRTLTLPFFLHAFFNLWGFGLGLHEAGIVTLAAFIVVMLKKSEVTPLSDSK